MKFTLAAATAILAGANSVSAFWRMPCRSRTGAARLDPLVDPGNIADHVHTFHGGGAISMDTTYDDLISNDTCTSCEVTQDKSAYWTPTLHFMWSNGTSQMVPQVGGMLAYYLMYLDDPSVLEAFPAGFRMLAGNRDVRNFTGPMPDTPLSDWPTDAADQFFLQQRALGFNCLNYDKDPEPSLYRHQFPSKADLDSNCTDGLRLEMAFPSCGNGEIDSDDHQSHVAYPSLVKEGNCPPGFDHHYPFLFFETIWATNKYVGEDGYFTLSHGDPIGTGYHGDFLMGWNEDFLQEAIRTCTSLSGEISDCPLFDIQTDADAAQCTFEIPSELDEDDCEGPRYGLAEDVPIQWGEEPATKYALVGKGGAGASSMAYTIPSTYAGAPTLSYSAANASETATAQGGIVVAAATGGLKGVFGLTKEATEASTSSTLSSSWSAPTASSSSSTADAPESSITTAASLPWSSSPADVVATSYITNGNEVVEMVIEQVDVTVTASQTGAGKYKRHVHHHQHGHRF